MINNEDFNKFSFSLLNAALESTADAILVVDKMGSVSLYNQKFVDMWQIPKDILDLNVDEKLLNYVVAKIARPEEFKDKVIELYGHPEESSLDSFNLVDGRIFERYSKPQRIGDEVVGRVWSFRDITEQKQLEESLLASQDKLTDIIDSLPNATLAIDQEGRVIIWNKLIEKMTGIPASVMIGKCDYAYNIPFYGDARPMLMDLVFRDDEKVAIQYPILTRDGEALLAEVFCPALYHNKGAWISVKAAPLHDHAGNIIGAIESIRDITDSKHAEAELRTSEAKYRLITENVSDVISVFNITKNKFTYVSPSVLEMRGFTVEEAMNERLEESLTPDVSAIVMDEVTRNVKEFMENPKEQKSYISEGQQPCKNGDIIWVEIVRTYRYNSSGDIESVGVIRNIEERKKAERQLLYISYHDQLTGLYNRRFYEEELDRLEKTRNLPLTIVLCDVNGLKLINDSFGHGVGDQLLVKSAKAIKSCCRADDFVARHGGDEFAIILPNANSMEAEQIIKRIKEVTEKETVQSINISISFGYETKTKPEEDLKDVFRKAEDHMYRHKLYESDSVRSKTVDLIMNTLYEKNHREMQHSKRVGELCAQLANAAKMSRDGVQQMRIAGLMHDIGKIGIDDAILNKVEKLSENEWKKIKKHSEIGYRILSSVNEFSEIADFVLEHQEKWDGTGYPKGLKGEEISVEARIIAIADAYDAMTGQRTYRGNMAKADAIEELKRCAGIQFDRKLTNIFIEKVLECETSNQVTIENIFNNASYMKEL